MGASSKVQIMATRQWAAELVTRTLDHDLKEKKVTECVLSILIDCFGRQ